MNKIYKNAVGQECLVISLCSGCLQDLQEYNPYIDSQGNRIPLERIIIVPVSQKECENTLLFQEEDK